MAGDTIGPTEVPVVAAGPHGSPEYVIQNGDHVEEVHWDSDKIWEGIANPLFAGQDGFVYGASWSAQDTWNTVPNGRWWEILRDYNQMSNFFNRAASSTQCIQHLRDMQAGGPGIQWTLDTNGIVFLDEGGGEEILQGNPVSIPLLQTSLTDGLRAMIRRFGAATAIDSSAMTTTGTWSSQGVAGFNGGSYDYCVTPGATKSFTFTGTACQISMVSLDQSLWVGRYFDVKVDGVTVHTNINPNRLATQGDMFFLHAGVSNFVVEISGLTNTLHTVQIISGGAVAGSLLNYLAIDCAFIPTSTPPLVVVQKAVLLPTYADAAEHNAWNAAMDAACAGIPYVVVVDLEPGFNAATMLGSDNVHPNDLGETHVVQRNMEELMKVHSLPF